MGIFPPKYTGNEQIIEDIVRELEKQIPRNPKYRNSYQSMSFLQRAADKYPAVCASTRFTDRVSAGRWIERLEKAMLIVYVTLVKNINKELELISARRKEYESVINWSSRLSQLWAAREMKKIDMQLEEMELLLKTSKHRDTGLKL